MNSNYNINEQINNIKKEYEKITSLKIEEFNVNNHILKVSLNPHFTTIDNIYNVNGKFIPGLFKNNNIYGVYHLNDTKTIYIFYKINVNKIEIYEKI